MVQVDMENIAAIVLAAGYSSRMGKFKPLLPFGAGLVVDRVVSCFQKAGVRDIVVVTGHGRQQVEAHLAGAGVRCTYNPDYVGGMFTSVLAGVRAVQKLGVGAFFLTPVDQPLVQPETVAAVVAGGGSAVVCYPAYAGERGHPPLISADCIPAILAHDGSGGLRQALLQFEVQARTIDVQDAGCVTDMDSWEDYQRCLALLEDGG